jgi:hypothetical protein
MVSPESAPGDRGPTLTIDTRGTRQSYGAVGEREPIGGSLPKCKNSPETHRNGRPLFDVPEEVEDEDLEELLEEEGFYLGSLPSFAITTKLELADATQDLTVPLSETIPSYPPLLSLFGSSLPWFRY